MDKVRLDVVVYEWVCPKCKAHNKETGEHLQGKCFACDHPVEYLPIS